MADLMEQEKLQYTIGDVSNMTGLSVDTLRFYEKSGVIGEVSRDRGGRRVFNKQNLDWLNFVSCLKSTGMSLDLIREDRDLMLQGDHTAPRRKELMVQHRELLKNQMKELKAAMDRINHKIEYYDEILQSHGI
jgi:DNA-binding transcriptional MerR regulator